MNVQLDYGLNKTQLIQVDLVQVKICVSILMELLNVVLLDTQEVWPILQLVLVCHQFSTIRRLSSFWSLIISVRKHVSGRTSRALLPSVMKSTTVWTTNHFNRFSFSHFVLDLDECATGLWSQRNSNNGTGPPCLSQDTCLNFPGTFQCCPPGYLRDTTNPLACAGTYLPPPATAVPPTLALLRSSSFSTADFFPLEHLVTRGFPPKGGSPWKPISK